MYLSHRVSNGRWAGTGARARVAAVALMLALAAAGPASTAWAQAGPGNPGSAPGAGGGGAGGTTRSPGDAESGKGDGTSAPGSEVSHGAGPDEPAPTGMASVLVVQVRFVGAGVVIVDGGALDSASAWAPYLAPGMWVRAEGTWQGAAFQARSLAITSPSAFCYYRGPASLLDGGQGWVEAWFAEEPDARAKSAGVNVLARRPMPPTDVAVWLGRWTRGAWQGAPAGVAPPAPPRDGWWLLRGELVSAAPSGTAAIRWGEAAAFGAP